MLPAAHMRIALDGEAYSYPEFIMWYGQHAQTMWNCAVESESHTFGKLLEEAQTYNEALRQMLTSGEEKAVAAAKAAGLKIEALRAEVVIARAAEAQATSALAAIDAELHEDIRRIREMLAADLWVDFTEGNDYVEYGCYSNCELCRGLLDRIVVVVEKLRCGTI